MPATWIGSETEYALVFIPEQPPIGSNQRPEKRVLFDCLQKALKSNYLLAEGSKTASYLPRYFIENGGCFYFEMDPKSMLNGRVAFRCREFA